MWLFTSRGFYSAVAHRDDPETIIVRARSAQDIKRLQKEYPYTKVVVGGGSDYRYRLEIDKADWADFVADEAADICYTNFKNEVAHTQGEWRHNVYMRIWWAMRDAFDPAPVYTNVRNDIPNVKINARTSMFAKRDRLSTDRFDDHANDVFEMLPGQSDCCGAKIMIVTGDALCEDCGLSAYGHNEVVA